jgi:mRNA interferase MazF
VTGLPRRGELWWCEPPEIGRRPVVVLSRDATIPRLRRVLVTPCTTNLRGLPSEVELQPGEDPVPRRTAVNLDSVESVSVALLVERIGVLSGPRKRRICARQLSATSNHQRSGATAHPPGTSRSDQGGIRQVTPSLGVGPLQTIKAAPKWGQIRLAHPPGTSRSDQGGIRQVTAPKNHASRWTGHYGCVL